MFFRKLKKKEGFTLVELIVTLAILGIFLAVGGTVYFQGNRMFNTTAVKSTEKSLGDNMYSFMREKLVYATKLQIIDPENPDQTPENKKVFKINETGHLDLNNNNIYGEAYYSGYTVGYYINVPQNTEGSLSKNQLDLTVYVKKDNEIVYQTGSIISNVNLIPQNEMIKVKKDAKKFSDLPYDNPIIAFEEDTSGGIVFTPIELRQYAMEVKKQVTAYANSNPKDESLLPDWWTKYTNNYTYISNDRIRQYVLMRYYRNDLVNENLNDYWPSFPGVDESIIIKTDNQIQELNKKYGSTLTTLLSQYLGKDGNKDLVLMCYTFLGTSNDLKLIDNSGNTKKVDIPGDDSCFVYVAPRLTSSTSVNYGWTAAFVYDFEEGCWYYNYRSGNNNDYTGNSILNTQWSDEGMVPGKDITYREFYMNEGVIGKPGIKERIHNEKYWIKIENK
ncbi:prepilin-type N-terminal cleavage/methylation domain-containing protein [Eubacterium callanderi]|uniref:Type II secretion system protein n=1 Tax=Eubacterium callanderi TaxID=53442 RepID=A0A853JPU2_9FIRM|nr:type II secretion system protein [Eubacterium callanderi]